MVLGSISIGTIVAGGNTISSAGITCNAATFTLTPASGGQILCNQTPTSATSVATKQYVDSAAAGGGALSALTDTNISTPANGQVLTYQSSDSKWHNVASSSVSASTQLTDFSNTTPSEGSKLVYRSGLWTPYVPVRYLTKVLFSAGGHNITVNGFEPILLRLTVGAIGNYLVSWYVRAQPNASTVYSKLWLTQDSSGTYSRTGTDYANSGEVGAMDDFEFQLMTNSIDNYAINGSSVVTITTANSHIALVGSIYAGGTWTCVGAVDDNSNLGSHMSAVLL